MSNQNLNLNPKTEEKIISLLEYIYGARQADRKETLKAESKLSSTLQSVPTIVRDQAYNFCAEMRSIIKAEGAEVTKDEAKVQTIRERTSGEIPDVEALTEAEQVEYSDVLYRSQHLKVRDEENANIVEAYKASQADPLDESLEELQQRYRTHSAEVVVQEGDNFNPALLEAFTSTLKK